MAGKETVTELQTVRSREQVINTMNGFLRRREDTRRQVVARLQHLKKVFTNSSFFQKREVSTKTNTTPFPYLFYLYCKCLSPKQEKTKCLSTLKTFLNPLTTLHWNNYKYIVPKIIIFIASVVFLSSYLVIIIVQLFFTSSQQWFIDNLHNIKGFIFHHCINFLQCTSTLQGKTAENH